MICSYLLVNIVVNVVVECLISLMGYLIDVVVGVLLLMMIIIAAYLLLLFLTDYTLLSTHPNLCHYYHCSICIIFNYLHYYLHYYFNYYYYHHHTLTLYPLPSSTLRTLSPCLSQQSTHPTPPHLSPFYRLTLQTISDTTPHHKARLTIFRTFPSKPSHQAVL